MTAAAERVVLVAVTRGGAAQAARLARALPDAVLCVPGKFASVLDGLPNRRLEGEMPMRERMPQLFAEADQLVCFVSLGAVVRLVAPLLRGKDVDPGVTVVDEAARFAIPVLSGHVGGANAMAERVAALLGATPVVTTASDVVATIPVDILGRELGWRVDADHDTLVRAAAAAVNGEPVALVQDAGRPDWWTRPTPLPATIHRLASIDAADPARFAALLWITHAEPDAAFRAAWAGRMVLYRPPVEAPAAAARPAASAAPGAAAAAPDASAAPAVRAAPAASPTGDDWASGAGEPPHDRGATARAAGPACARRRRVAAGVGCDRGTPRATVRAALDAALADAGLCDADVAALATIDLKADEPALQQLATELGLPLRCYAAAELARIAVPNPSATVLRHVGTPSVSEAAALVAAGAAMDALLVEKRRLRGPCGRSATVSLAELNTESLETPA